MKGEIPALEAHDLTVAYQREPVLYGVDVRIAQGSLVGVMGPNGAGKSTFLKAAVGLLPVRSGWVKFFGRPHREVCQRVGYVPQRESVDWDFPVNVREVVMMGRQRYIGLAGRPTARDREVVEESLLRVGLTDLAGRQIGRLSGGQQQRVFLARALVQEADVYLMDEPFAGVDAATEAAIVEVFRELKSRGKTVVVVHHDLATAREYFDHLLLLNMRLVAFGPSEDVLSEKNLRATYGGKLTLLDTLAGRLVVR